eukprot:4318062-Pyramimonas_sp.AAC.1
MESGATFSWIYGRKHKDSVKMGQLGQPAGASNLDKPQPIPGLAGERVRESGSAGCVNLGQPGQLGA